MSTFAVMASMAEKDRLRIAELEADKERLLLMEEHAVQSFNELTRKYDVMEQQLAELLELTQRMYTHVTEDMGEMTSAEFEEWMTKADAALLQESDDE